MNYITNQSNDEKLSVFIVSLQLASAAAICIFYTILMMAVLVGLVVDAANSGLCSVTSLAMLVLSIVIYVTALLHPMVC